jgi:serine O-acetyltransferase
MDLTGLPEAEPAGPRRRAEDAGLVSATVPDWSRESAPVGRWDPPRALLRAFRDHARWSGPGWIHRLLRGQALLRHRFWSAVTGADLPLGTRIEGGLLLPHPNGIVVHSDVRIGPNCILFQQVTLGVGGPKPGAPVLEGHVDVGAGARVLGGVRIGAHATIGANAVVLQDVPAGATAVGVPARVIPLA